MISVLRNIRGYLRYVLHSGPTHREFDRLGLTLEVLDARAHDIDAAAPDFAQTRGKSWAAIGDASAAYLSLLRELPDRAGPDAVIAHFRRAASRRTGSRSPEA